MDLLALIETIKTQCSTTNHALKRLAENPDVHSSYRTLAKNQALILTELLTEIVVVLQNLEDKSR